MKKAILFCAMLMILLTGCMKSEDPVVPSGVPDNGEEENMEGFVLKEDREYGILSLSWKRESADLIARVSIMDEEGKELYVFQTYSESANVKDLLAYACQENGYHGLISVKAQLLDRTSNEVKEEYISEPIDSTEWFPVEEVLDVTGRDLAEFHWMRSRPTSYVEEPVGLLDSFDIYVNEDSTTFYATYYNASGKEKTIEKEWNEKDLERFSAYTKEGRVVRRVVDDPDMVLLDGPSEENMSAVYEGADIQERKWYEFRMDREAKERLLDAVYQYCKNGGKWPKE